jgi:uncharacterized protein (DUF2267 family)
VDHEAFIDVVRAAAALDRDGAERATRATLHTLAERIDRGEARALATRLPPELAPWVATTTSAERFDVELVRRVAQREGVHEPIAYGHIRAVFDALARAVGPDELADVAAQLPKDYAPLLPRGVYVEVVPADGFLAQVAERADLDLEGARRATDAVLETLAERIAGGEVRDLMAHLPIELHDPLRRGSERNGGRAQRMSSERFMALIAGREGVTPDVARRHARAVVAALREAVGDDELFDVTVQLPPELAAELAIT